jgi:hypothetical protein
LGGALSLWLAHWMGRLRLEVTPWGVWALPLVGAPRYVALGDIVRLVPELLSHGGIVARSATKKLFSASRIMLGYPLLIEHLRICRPDLEIPFESLP